jgi:hypothetical protein
MRMKVSGGVVFGIVAVYTRQRGMPIDGGR